MCEVAEIMEKDEQYARSWVRLCSRPENSEIAAHMAQYALDLMRLKHEHEDRCKTCKG